MNQEVIDMDDEKREYIRERNRRYIKNNYDKVLESHRQWHKKVREEILNLSDEEFLIWAGLREPLEVPDENLLVKQKNKNMGNR